MKGSCFLTIQRRDNKILVSQNVVHFDLPVGWYEFHSIDLVNIQILYNGLMEILTLENLKPKKSYSSIYPRERIKSLISYNKTKLVKLAKRYKFQYIVYETIYVNQLVAIKFFTTKDEFLFRIKFSHILDLSYTKFKS